MLLSTDSINSLVNIILGNSGLTNKINKSEVDEFLKSGGIEPSSFDSFFYDYNEIKSNPLYGNKKFKLEKYLLYNLKNINKTYRIYKVVDAYFSQLYHYTNNELEVLAYINEAFEKDNYQIVQLEETGEYKIYSLDDSMVNYDCIFKEKEIGNYFLINQQCEKCIDKIHRGDYMGAITNSASLIEQLLQEIINDVVLKKKVKYNYQLKTFVKSILSCFFVGSEGNPIQKKINSNLKLGFINLVESIGLMRNNMSDAHRVLPDLQPTKKDALLAVNTAKTIANFIVAEYFEKFGGSQ